MGKGRGAASGSGGLTGCDDDDDDTLFEIWDNVSSGSKYDRGQEGKG